MNKFLNIQANLPLISLITLAQNLQTSQGRAIVRLQNYNRVRIDWDICEKRKNDDKNAQRSVKTHCRQWVCGHCDWSFFVWRFLTSESDVKKKSANRVFYISPNKGYFGKAIFSRLFSARYYILKKKKKKTILGLCRCSVDNYSLNPGDLPCQF